ncbi:rhomboid family intramembrane serine protease [Halomarina litorea]|uniref:rhomboid family intramembrane serine protease n=1 Tax=Halomarina litorea TaxID=2961595 RepID=UPI0020C3D345|nr:rhomboid family intramembrane serine protease [Halomarina sp. BCD28]
MVTAPGWLPAQQLLLVAVALLSFGVALRLAGVGESVGPRLRSRFVLGVPWGTFSITLFVLWVYLVVQGGWHHPYSPTVLPYRAWSYFYPLGMLVSPFAHASLGHLVGNLVGTLTFGTMAEYAWSHYPRERGRQTFTSLGTNPFARIALFVAGTLAVGVLTGLFVLGPSIGFSGVVFGFAGFALLRYPIGTVVALTAGQVLSLLYSALRTPTVEAGGQPAFVTPWWSNIAIQGHALGLFIGAVLAVLLVRRRDARPSALRLWLATLLFAASQGLWAVYVPLSGGQFRLYRAVGTALVFVLAALFVSAVRSPDRTLLSRIDLSYREATFGLVVGVTLALALVAVPFNLFAVANPDAGVTEQNSVEVHDYTVFYAHDVPNQYVSAVDVDALGASSSVNASGVIVASADREVWWEVVPTSRLAYDGRSYVRVGGLGWRDTVVANFSGWTPAGNRTAYVVSLEHDDTRRLAFASKPSTADPTIEGRNVTFVPGREFTLVVSRADETVGKAALPGVNRTTSAGGLTFSREDHARGDRIYVSTANGTRVRIATEPSRP